MEMRPCVALGVSSGMHASREAEHHSKTRGQGELPRAQHLKMWKQFGGLCVRIVGEPLRTLLQSLMLYGTVQTILTCDLNMHRVAAKFVPRLLTPKQKEHRAAICQELRQRAVDVPSFMSRVITGIFFLMIRRPPRSTQVFTMEEPRIPKTEEGEAELQRDQEHAHRVFRHSRDCAP
jgi:hypothetical protein